MLNHAIELVEQGRIPDFITRTGIRQIIRSRHVEQHREYREPAAWRDFLAEMDRSPLAAATDAANTQHYEVPTAFYRTVLGPRLKYSCSLFDHADDSLEVAEERMLALSAARAELEDGQHILELGCGWGSLTLWMAAQFPAARITAVSNSATQKAWIDSEATARGLGNVTVITADMNDFQTSETFDRVVSIEMFEHMRNHRLLFERIANWLEPGGRLFFHIFCHRHFPYFYEVRSETDWMARHFFSGGMMPAWDLPLLAQDALTLEDRWAIDGRHYALTCERWLANCDRNRATVISALAGGDNPAPPEVQCQRWRMFFMACRELFAWGNGQHWHVGHYRFVKP